MYPTEFVYLPQQSTQLVGWRLDPSTQLSLPGSRNDFMLRLLPLSQPDEFSVCVTLDGMKLPPHLSFGNGNGQTR